MEPLTWPALFFAAGSCQCLDRGQVCCSEAHRGRPEPASRQAVEQPSRRLVNRHTVNFILIILALLLKVSAKNKTKHTHSYKTNKSKTNHVKILACT